jgi:cobyrinic acid a,c-diamide synthase
MSRLYLSAAHKSSGKTTVTIGLLAALRARGVTVQPFKKGPDYIDPMWLSAASGRQCRNLDFYVMENDEIRDLFCRAARDADLALVEGNKGLHDGLDLEGTNSNAAMAKLLDAPAVLVLDTRGTIRGVAPLLLGYQAFDPKVRIGGVILNLVGGARHESKLRAVIEHYTDIPVLGAIHRDPSMQILERHLGLVPANEAGEAAAQIAAMGRTVAAQVDLDRLLAVANVGPFDCPKPVSAPAFSGRRLRVGIARDRAFGFYYADDLEALEAAGAELVPIDCLHDQTLPALDGLFIGGGFPESFLDELEANASMRGQIRAAIDAGLPAYAECGGLMYLSRSITWQGRTRQMAGVIPGDVTMQDKPIGKGYVRLNPVEHPWGGEWPAVITAHEFHYSRIDKLPADTRFAYGVERGYGVDGRRDGIVHQNLLANYTHLRSLRACNWAERFLQFIRSKQC